MVLKDHQLLKRPLPKLISNTYGGFNVLFSDMEQWISSLDPLWSLSYACYRYGVLGLDTLFCLRIMLQKLSFFDSTGAATVYELSVVDARLSPRLNTFSFHGVRRNRHTMIHCSLRSFSICTCQQVACSRLRDSGVPYPLPLSTPATQAKKVRTRKQETAPPTFSCLSLSRQMKACISYLHLRQRNI